MKNAAKDSCNETLSTNPQLVLCDQKGIINLTQIINDCKIDYNGTLTDIWPEFYLNSVKGQCKFILLNDQSFSDPDVSLVFQHVFTLCTMEVSMQKYIEYRESFKEKEDEVTAQTKIYLLNLQTIIPTFLNAFEATKEMFDKNNLREKLNEKRDDYRQNNTLDQDSY